MKKISLSISLEGCRLAHSELKNVTGGKSCTYSRDGDSVVIHNLSQAQAEALQDRFGGDVVC